MASSAERLATARIRQEGNESRPSFGGEAFERADHGIT
jgi:hypothetical protein